ncbi:DUF4381 domain-containing protein [Beggiatoa leptomitoformis]|nr:DUF4381 domain-containing protein [Beggiatoa leptomitoformis]
MNPTPELALRDIHLPDPVSWFPPALGWWLLLIIVPLLIGLVFWVWRYRQRIQTSPQKNALTRLQQLEQQYQTHQNTQQLVIELSRLLRRACLSYYNRQQVAGLTGEAWLQFLDKPLVNQPFSQGIGRALSEMPYQATANVDAPALITLCREWLKKLPAQSSQLNHPQK